MQEKYQLILPCRKQIDLSIEKYYFVVVVNIDMDRTRTKITV